MDVVDSAIIEQQESGIVHAVVDRINQMEDLMSSMQEGAVKHLELKNEQDRLKATDGNYIRAKLEMMRRHGEKLLEDILHHPNITDHKVDSWTPQQRKALDERIDAAEAACDQRALEFAPTPKYADRSYQAYQILDRIAAHNKDSKSNPISYQDYEKLLRTLTFQYGAPIVPDDSTRRDITQLRQAHVELPNMRAAMERAQRDQYDQLAVGDVGREVQKLKQKQDDQQKRWLQKFNDHVKKERRLHANRASALEVGVGMEFGGD